MAALPWIGGAFLAAALITFVLTPLVRRMAVAADAVDRPGHRRVNVKPIARGGGLAIAGGFISVAVLIALPGLATAELPLPAALSGGQLAILLAGSGLAAAIAIR